MTALEVQLAEKAIEIAQLQLEVARQKAAEPVRQAIYPRRHEGAPRNSDMREFLLANVGTHYTTNQFLKELWIGYDPEQANIEGTFSFKARKSFSVRIEQVAAYLADPANGPTYQVYKSRLKRDPMRKREDQQHNRQKLWWIVRDPLAKPEVLCGE